MRSHFRIFEVRLAVGFLALLGLLHPASPGQASLQRHSGKEAPWDVRAAPGAPQTQPRQVAARQQTRIQPNSADRMLFWVGAEDVIGLTDPELDLWKSRGVGGFICMTRHLPGMGGTTRFTGDPTVDLSATGYEIQRGFRNSRVVQRARERGMKLYLGCWLVNYFNPATPLKDWFDDPGWANEVIPRIRELAAAAKLLGFAGIAFDQELYPQSRGGTATWAWSYPGNTHSETEVRLKAKQRGQELMRAILEGFPGVEIVVYHYQFPETWESVVQKQINHIDNVGAPVLFTEFWDGLSSTEGYSAIRFINALFYKTPHLGTWDAALQYEMNSFYSLLDLIHFKPCALLAKPSI